MTVGEGEKVRQTKELYSRTSQIKQVDYLSLPSMSQQNWDICSIYGDMVELLQKDFRASLNLRL